jgi:peptidoglycan hydrolase CwlO-like protein
LRARALAALFAVVSATVGTTIPARALSCAPNDYICQELQAAQASQAAAQAQLDRIQGQIQDVQQKEHQLNLLIKQLNGQIVVQQKAIAATQSRIDELDRQIRFTLADIQRRETHLVVREDLFGERVRSLDKHGTVNYFELVVTSTSFNQLIDRLLVMQEVVRADRKMLDELTQQRLQVDQAKADLADKRGQEATLLDQQKAQEAQLEQTRALQQSALAYQQQLEAELQQYAEEEAAQLAAITQEVGILQQAYQNELDGLTGGGRLNGRLHHREREDVVVDLAPGGPATRPHRAREVRQ